MCRDSIYVDADKIKYFYFFLPPTSAMIHLSMTSDIDLKKVKKVHFIGIGGIGISAIARMMLLEGKEISGSDSSSSDLIEELKKLGATIYKGHATEQIHKDLDLVIYTIAIPDTNPELVEAKRLGIPMLTYPQTLTLVSRDKYTIAISGTHGKTTTTAMVAKIMIDAGLDPTVIVGSILKGEKSNFIAGKGECFVIEACEYRRSFLNLKPNILIITNIDNDHLDYYKDITDIQSAFIELVGKMGPGDYLICDTRDENLKPVIDSAKCIVLDYGSVSKTPFNLKVPGVHNRKNASAALMVGNVLGLSPEKSLDSLSQFGGTWRRFEYKGLTEKGAQVYHDYGHHPTEIAATIAGARELFPTQKIVVVFEPHLFSRTKLLLKDFGKCFNQADEVVLAPIYPAREKFDPTITSEMLRDEIAANKIKATVFKNAQDIETYVKKETGTDDVVLVSGAGDLYTHLNLVVL